MFPQLFDHIPDALIVVAPDGRIVLSNARAEAMFGYPPQGLEGRRVEALMPAGARARHRGHRAGYMAQPRTRAMGDTGQALVGQRADGAQFPVEIALSPIDDGGRTLYLASIRDISETQRARQALVRSGYDALVARIGQLALEAGDEASVIAQVPPLLADALDVEVVALAFQRPEQDRSEVRAWHGLDAGWDRTAALLARPSPALWRALAGTQPQVVQDAGGDGAGAPAPASHPAPAAAGESTPFPFALVDGARSGAVVPLLDRDRPMGMLVALSRRPHRFDHDALHLLQSVAIMVSALVQRRRTEEQLAHSQRLDAIGQLTGGIAHDFNNLLTIMSGNLQLLEDEYPQPPGAADLIAGALRSVDRGAELTAKLLAFARRQRLQPGAVDAQRLLLDLQLMLGRTLGELVRVAVDCDTPVPRAFADAMQLESALVNLALNARDAMPRGGEVALSASLREVAGDASGHDLAPGQYVVFTVTDTGMGMAPDTLARAIDPFFTTKEVGRGSGLGLSMAYGFARQSGGALRIDSHLGYGTRVELFLPAACDPARAPPVAGDAVATPGEGRVVLVVEDEAEVRNIAMAFLRSLGYRVHGFAAAEPALAHLQRDGRVALLFTDVMLGGGMDGVQLAQAARRACPELPVLLTSGYQDPVAAQTRADMARFELLRKPYRRQQLAAAVGRCAARGSDAMPAAAVAEGSVGRGPGRVGPGS